MKRITYKNLNSHLKFYGCFISNKKVLINQKQDATIYSKFDFKFGF